MLIAYRNLIYVTLKFYPFDYFSSLRIWCTTWCVMNWEICNCIVDRLQQLLSSSTRIWRFLNVKWEDIWQHEKHLMILGNQGKSCKCQKEEWTHVNWRKPMDIWSALNLYQIIHKQASRNIWITKLDPRNDCYNIN